MIRYLVGKNRGNEDFLAERSDLFGSIFSPLLIQCVCREKSHRETECWLRVIPSFRLRVPYKVRSEPLLKTLLSCSETYLSYFGSIFFLSSVQHGTSRRCVLVPLHGPLRMANNQPLSRKQAPRVVLMNFAKENISISKSKFDRTCYKSSRCRYLRIF